MNNLFSLHKYFVYQLEVRRSLDKFFLQKGLSKHELESKDAYINIYLDLWLWTLYVLIEWWIELWLEDENIDQLLKSKNVTLLRRYRNCIFHFQRDWYDKRFNDLYESEDHIGWTDQLLVEFKRYFLEQIKLWNVIAPNLPDKYK
jgi:hypothetical protein